MPVSARTPVTAAPRAPGDVMPGTIVAPTGLPGAGKPNAVLFYDGPGSPMSEGLTGANTPPNGTLYFEHGSAGPPPIPGRMWIVLGSWVRLTMVIA